MADASLLGFTGAFVDPVTAAYPLGNGYRWFLPALMRFNAPDSLSPFGAGGINPYAYCADDPVNRSDPSGHVSINPVIAAFVEDSVHRAYRGEAPYEPITAPQPTPRRKPPPADGETVDSDSDSYPFLKTPRKRLRSGSYSPPRSPTRIPAPTSSFSFDMSYHEEGGISVRPTGTGTPPMLAEENAGLRVPTVQEAIGMAQSAPIRPNGGTGKIQFIFSFVRIVKSYNRTVPELPGYTEQSIPGIVEAAGYQNFSTFENAVIQRLKTGMSPEPYQTTYEVFGMDFDALRKRMATKRKNNGA